MTDAAVVGRILREYHQAGIEPSGIRRLTGNRPSVWHIHPDEKRIAAIAAGYSRWRQLQPVEKDPLLEGTRFPAAYVGAIDLEQALLTGVRGRSMDVKLEWLRNRLTVSDAIAALARRHFG